MTVKINNCNGVDAELFVDLAKHEYIDDWLLAIEAGRSKFQPRNVFVRIGQKMYYWGSGIDLQHRLSMEFIAGVVRELPPSRRMVRSDGLQIRVDGVDRELHIEL